MGHHLNCMFFVAFSAHVAVNCYASEVFYRDPGHPPVNQGFVCRSRQERSLSNNDTETASIQPSQKKWQVGRVSRKQYEIVNMLWRNTKASIDVESTTSSSQANNNSRRKDSNNGIETKFVHRLITPSFIEFYYLEESEDLDKHKSSSIKKIDTTTTDKTTPKTVSFEQRRPIARFPIISFRVNDPSIKRFNRKQRINPDDFLIDHLIKSRNYSLNGKHFKSMKLFDLFGNKTIWGKKLVSVKVFLNGSRVSTSQSTKKDETETAKQTTTPLTSFRMESKTPGDRIKFFEMYDSNTVPPSLKNNNKSKYNDYESSDEKIDLENVDQNIGHFNSESKLRYEKKHITGASLTMTIENVTPVEENFQSNKANSSDVFRERNALELSLEQKLRPGVANESKLASWAAYPFVAVYVYEPTQTHCDAAGISPHWLIAAGSCLSRHGSVHSVEARSAFVTYCGESWRQPERIAYVKNSFVHPKFHPRDKNRRYNYNIGLIEVSGSMESSCPKWSPITLMSHQFAASPGGSLLSALGWGLDRYGTKYMTENVPPWPLTVYEGLVYSDSCPGSNAYSFSKAKGGDAESGAENVYCLLLPPYSGEQTDPVHGGLLLDGGKLVALYLQEERRPWGAQSAQYTGVWRLIPWVLDAARERDDTDSLSWDM